MSDDTYNVRARLAVAGSSGRRPRLKDPLAHVGGQSVRRAAGSSTQAGQYVRRTFTFREEQLARLRALAAEWEVSENDAARWLIDIALKEVGGGRRPEVVASGRRIVG